MEFKIQSDVIEIQSTPPIQTIDWGVNVVQAPEMWSVTKRRGY